MQYNTTKGDLTMPEYGRHIQNMINHAINLDNKKEQKECVDSIMSKDPHLSFPEHYGVLMRLRAKRSLFQTKILN